MKHVVGIRERVIGSPLGPGVFEAVCDPCGWVSDPYGQALNAQAAALAHQGGTLHTNEKRVSPLRVPRTGDDMTDEAFPGVK